MSSFANNEDAGDLRAMHDADASEFLECPVCHKPADYLERFYDRHNIYSGRACSEKCGSTLPGQGRMRDYEAEEPIDPD